MGRDYNKYPEDMVELVVAEEFEDGTKTLQTFCNMQDLEAYFRYCHTEHESRQAYKDGNIFSMHEDLRITWIKEEKNLGYAIGRKGNTVKFYKIGKEEDWETMGRAMAAANAHDNS